MMIFTVTEKNRDATELYINDVLLKKVEYTEKRIEELQQKLYQDCKWRTYFHLKWHRLRWKFWETVMIRYSILLADYDDENDDLQEDIKPKKLKLWLQQSLIDDPSRESEIVNTVFLGSYNRLHGIAYKNKVATPEEKLRYALYEGLPVDYVL